MMKSYPGGGNGDTIGAVIRIRPLEPAEIERISELILTSFNRFVAPLYPPEGVETFTRFVAPEALSSRIKEGNVLLVADRDGEIVGAVETGTESHILLLFVRIDQHRRSIGTRLLREGIELCRKKHPASAKVTLHSAPNVVEFYERNGFAVTGPMEERDGIRFVPMVLPLTQPRENNRAPRP
jgi:ribosomal protein S18 acetylase RimI-like enzyme